MAKKLKDMLYRCFTWKFLKTLKTLTNDLNIAEIRIHVRSADLVNSPESPREITSDRNVIWHRNCIYCTEQCEQTFCAATLGGSFAKQTIIMVSVFNYLELEFRRGKFLYECVLSILLYVSLVYICEILSCV